MNATWIDTLRLAATAVARPGSRAQSRPGIRFVPTRNAVVRVRAVGERQAGQPLTILLVCDPPNVIEHFDALLDLLAPQARVICFEPPGFGFSLPRTTFGFGFGDYAACFAELLDALGEGPYLLAFPCIWGHLALQLGAQRPDAVRKLMLWQTARWEQQVAWARAADPDRVLLRPYVGQFTMAVTPEKVAGLWYRAALAKGRAADFMPTLHAALRAGGFCCLGSLWQAWFGADRTAGTARPEQPALLAWGAADRSHRQTDRFGLAAGLPAAVRQHVFESAGHSPELENPAAFAAVLQSWLAE